MASQNVIPLSDTSFEDQVLKSPIPVLVDFWATWCGPCKMIAPMVEELANDFEGKLKVGKLDVDNNGQTPGQYGIMSIPTLILFKDGQPVEKLVGYQPKEHLVRMINKVLP